MLLNLITGCDDLTTFLEKMTSWTCFDSFRSNDIFYLKVQSSTFVGIKIKIFSSNIYSRNGWENSGASAKHFTIDEILLERSLIYIKKRSRVFPTGAMGGVTPLANELLIPPIKKNSPSRLLLTKFLFSPPKDHSLPTPPPLSNNFHVTTQSKLTLAVIITPVPYLFQLHTFSTHRSC